MRIARREYISSSNNPSSVQHPVQIGLCMATKPFDQTPFVIRPLLKQRSGGLLSLSFHFSSCRSRYLFQNMELSTTIVVHNWNVPIRLYSQPRSPICQSRARIVQQGWLTSGTIFGYPRADTPTHDGRDTGAQRRFVMLLAVT